MIHTSHELGGSVYCFKSGWYLFWELDDIWDWDVLAARTKSLQHSPINFTVWEVSYNFYIVFIKSCSLTL